MNIPHIPRHKFILFFATAKYYLGDELIHFHGTCIGDNMSNYNSWMFCLVNHTRTNTLLIDSSIAFYFINLSLTNISPLPNSLVTENTTISKMQFLYEKYDSEQNDKKM